MILVNLIIKSICIYRLRGISILHAHSKYGYVCTYSGKGPVGPVKDYRHRSYMSTLNIAKSISGSRIDPLS